MSTQETPFGMMARAVGFSLFIALAGCNPQPPAQDGPFEEGRVLGVNKNHKLEETSGLAASRRHPGMLWAHNDSGHPADLFLLDTTGQTVATFRVAGIRNRDWEDIAIGSGMDGPATIFIGDIGDNRLRNPLKYIYCVPEPGFDTSAEVAAQDTLIIRFDDQPRDTEALLIDPLTRNLYLVSKFEPEVRVYEITYPYTHDTIGVTPSLELQLQYITAGDISRDGSEILLKSYTSVYYWRRGPNQSVLEAIQQEPLELAYERESQGESIAWAFDASGFYTLSENGKGERGRLIFYARRAPGDSTAHRP